MSKYRSREAPLPGASVSETHPGFWAEHIELERKIADKWYANYGHHYYENSFELPSSARKFQQHQMNGYKTLLHHEHPDDRQVPCSEPVAYFKSCIRDAELRGLSGHKSIADKPVSSKYTGYKVLPTPHDRYRGLHPSGYCSLNEHQRLTRYQSHNVQDEPKMAFDSSPPGNVQQHYAVKDPVTSYSSSFGHHGYQNNFENLQSYKKMERSYPQYNRYKFHSASSDPDLVCYTPEAYNLSMLAQQKYAACSLDQLRREKSSSLPDLPSGTERCPKCLRMSCCCVPRRRQNVTEKGNYIPLEELPPWPSQISHGPSYSGNKCTTEGEKIRQRFMLRTDPDLKTPVNQMCDKMNQINFCDGKVHHSGPTLFSSGAVCHPAYSSSAAVCHPAYSSSAAVCHPAYSSNAAVCHPAYSSNAAVCHPAYSSRSRIPFDEQLRRGNPFIIGDTKFRASAYASRI